MSKPIIDKAEVSIDFPDKYYYGSFGRESRFDVTVDDHGVHIALDRGGDEKRAVAFHIHHYLFGDILETIAEAVKEKDGLPEADRERMREAAQDLATALGPKKRTRRKRGA